MRLMVVTEPAVEAARIAAETASHNAEVTAYVAAGAAFLALVGTVVTSVNSVRIAKKTSLISKEIGDKNVQSLEKRRLIDTISSQRIMWINSIRKEFVDFNKVSHTYMMEKFSILSGNNSNYDFGEQYQHMVAVKNHIELLLNPTETFSTKLLYCLDKILDTLHKESGDLNEYKEFKDATGFIQQVILKAEWRRIKKETERGEQISTEEMNLIFKEVATEINEIKYDYLFS
ncbi:hypothetical protein [Priestia aryabhattai]|uniref:hypothetical protein n=1 Tax=Priestia aryabhattai TaxID=412384 RepID=UPI003D291ABD